MAIISKPSTVIKGTNAEFTLNVSELVAAISDLHFKDTTNWRSVSLHYKSVQGNQFKVVKFNTNVQSFSSTFLASSKTRGIFNIQKIVIKDFDNDYIVITRQQLEVADFDVEPVDSNQDNYILLEDGNVLAFEDSINAILN